MGLSLTIEYPEKLLDALQTTRQDFEREVKMAMAVKLYELKRLSSGMAAALAGVDRVSFLLSLHRYGTPVIDLDDDELVSDVENA
jgi:predicted HTH domain antitoxin